MQNNRFSHARRIFLVLAAALGLAAAGCKTTTITNLTPSALPENPSQIYTIAVRATPKDTGFVPGSVSPSIVIDGQTYRMKTSPLGEDIFEFDYQVPAGRNEIAYYFVIHYQIETNSGILATREEYSQLQRSQIMSRYVLSLESNRGPVGAKVSVLGRGFTPNDIVFFDDLPVRTAFESPNAVSFYVPAVEGNKNYRVSIGTAPGQSPVGTFRVDAVGGNSTSVGSNFATADAGSVNVNVSPSSLNLRRGEKAQLTFTTPNTAATGGILVDVTTDIPESVIMPEVVIPAGSNTVTITVEGGRPGIGSLFVKGAGGRELSIPVTVK